MRKILLSLGLLSAMILCTGALAAADDNDNKPKKVKGKLRERLRGRLGKLRIDHDELFAKLDADKDGKLTREEFRKVFEHLGEGRLGDILGDKLDPVADFLFDRLDKDEDGKLSKEEFAEFGLEGLLRNLDLGDLKDKFGKKEKKDDKKDQ
jgi:hypothetical protein